MLVGVVLAALAVVVWVGAARARPRRGPRLLTGVGSLYRRCYDRRGLLRLGAATLGAALLAHGGLDEAADRWHAGRVRGPRSDALSDQLRPFGERFWFLVWAAVAVVDATVGSSPLTRWGRRNFRTLLVGLPALWTIQRVCGASRPTDPPASPRYHPMADDNTASGHTFVAAIPWLHLARRAGGRPARWAALAASWATGWSRLNDRKHYLSQVLLGYAIAWHAVEVVDTLDREAPPVALRPDGGAEADRR